MKKAKIMLTSIAIVGVVAGALAFQAHKYGSVIYTGPDAQDCTFTVQDVTITPAQSGTQTFATTAFGDPNCALTFTTVNP